MQSEPDADRMAFETGPRFGPQLLQALGLADLQGVVRVQLDVQADDVVRVNVTQVMVRRSGMALCELVSTGYALVPSDAPRSVHVVKPGGSAPDSFHP